jgi:hypothetical protein
MNSRAAVSCAAGLQCQKHSFHVHEKNYRRVSVSDDGKVRK